MKILVVEDQKSLAKVIAEILKKDKHLVDVVYDGQDGYEYIKLYDYDVVVLDVMMPRMNGFQVIKKLRQEENTTPILLLTAKSQLEDKIEGLDCGADDYLTKPFEPLELLARIRAAGRRKDVFVGNQLKYSDLTIDKSELTFSTRHDCVPVTLKEYQILELLISTKQIISKEKFTEAIWGYDYDKEYNQVEVYISFIRKKLKHIQSKVKIVVRRGVGYTLEVPDD